MKKAKKAHMMYNILNEPQIPLPALESILKEKIEKQLLSRVNLAKERALPTIGQISMLNTYKQLNCVTLSDSGAVLAAGMADCTVKVFILSKK